MKLVIGLPSLLPGVNATDTEASPPTATPITGARGARAGITAFDTADGAVVPMEFVAVTAQTYVAPMVSDPTTIGLDGPDTPPSAPPFEDTHVAS